MAAKKKVVVVEADVVEAVETKTEPKEFIVARTMSADRIRERLEKLEKQMEAEKNKLLAAKNANVDPTKLVGFSEVRQMVYQWHQEHRVPYAKVVEALVKSDMGEEFTVLIRKPRGPRQPK